METGKLTRSQILWFVAAAVFVAGKHFFSDAPSQKRATTPPNTVTTESAQPRLPKIRPESAPRPLFERSEAPPPRRGAHIPEPDDPWTTNDETNDQPVGYFGTLTLTVLSLESGNTYTLDVELDGLEVSQVYFPRGGWIDFFGCELAEGFEGTCIDEEGRTWVFLGE